MSSPAFWVNTTYFAEGLPYTLLLNLTAAYFTDLGVSTEKLGYLNILGAAWNFKFVWAPLVDRFGSYRGWLIAVQAVLGLFMAAAAFLAFGVARSPGNVALITGLAVVFALMAFPAATNDIAIDGYYLQAIPDRTEQARYTGLRVLAYRVAMIFARTGLVALVAVVAKRMGTPTGWAWAFAAAGLTLVLLSTLHQFSLPRLPPRPREPRIFQSYLQAWLSYFRQDRIALSIVFIALYKLGDAVLFSMSTTFLKRELLVSNQQFAWLGGLVTAGGAILGAMWGAAWIRRRGLEKAIWPLTLLMNLNMWAYIWLAWAKPLGTSPHGLWVIACVQGYEQIAAGLGNAVLVTYLLRTCKPEHSAAHYAIGSAIMSVGGTVLGAYSGKIVHAHGYVGLFLIAFAASVPAMLLLPFIPLRPRPAPSSAASP